jgi:ADP-heptose:LPS heptosyltransferase
MGLGGYLTWTAVAREIKNRIGVKCIPIEQAGNGIIKIIKSDIFQNNPNIIQKIDDSEYALPITLNNPNTNYCKKDTPEKAYHRYDKHIVEQICESYGFTPSSNKPDLYFTEEEISYVESILRKEKIYDKNFLVIEPQSNDEYTVNKVYPIEKWQKIVDELVKNYTIVQIGKENKQKVLKNVINLTGLTTFRQAACLLSYSKLFISSEGGLMHAARAVNTKSVIVYTGFIHPKMTGYEENINLWIGETHGPCGMKIRCENCLNDTNRHNPEEIIKIVRELIK